MVPKDLSIIQGKTALRHSNTESGVYLQLLQDPVNLGLLAVLPQPARKLDLSSAKT